ncbi:hypothetical protein CHRYSEOSP005_30700 [Chryseobacterium sp. Alg-005]|uniref:bacteriocin-like protein n=1 Tax=Chryseobacterium sp. Alg-005 TaxID=3159516 RepID=UPI0035557915
MKNLKQLDRKRMKGIAGAGYPIPYPDFCYDICSPSGGTWVPQRCACLCVLEP